MICALMQWCGAGRTSYEKMILIIIIIMYDGHVLCSKHYCNNLSSNIYI